MSTERPDGRRSWLTAVVGAFAMIFTFGTPMSYGIFRTPFSEAFDVSPLALSGVFALMLCTFFIGSGLVGVFGVRFPPRVLLAGCAVATAAIAPTLFVVRSLAVLAVVFAVLGLALGTTFVLVASVVPRWFDRRRSAATGLIFVGNGLGLLVLPPLWQVAITEYGVAQSFFTILAVTSVAFALAAITCRRPEWADNSGTSAGEVAGWLRELSHTRTFQLLVVGIACSFAWYQLLAAFAVDLFAARGLSAAGASLAFGLIGGVSIVSRIGGGYLGDVVGAKRAFVGSLWFIAVGLSVLFVPLEATLWLAIVCIGLGLGANATLYIPLLLAIYPQERDTAVVGVFNIAGGIAALAMPPLGTVTIAIADGYALVLTLTLVVTLLAIVTVTRGARPGRHREQ